MWRFVGRALGRINPLIDQLRDAQTAVEVGRLKDIGNLGAARDDQMRFVVTLPCDDPIRRLIEIERGRIACGCAGQLGDAPVRVNLRNAPVTTRLDAVRIEWLDVEVRVVAVDLEQCHADAENPHHLDVLNESAIDAVALVRLLDSSQDCGGQVLPVVGGNLVALADGVAGGHGARLIDQPMLRDNGAHLIPDKALRAVPKRLYVRHPNLTERKNRFQRVVIIIGILRELGQRLAVASHDVGISHGDRERRFVELPQAGVLRHVRVNLYIRRKERIAQRWAAVRPFGGDYLGRRVVEQPAEKTF